MVVCNLLKNGVLPACTSMMMITMTFLIFLCARINTFYVHIFFSPLKFLTCNWFWPSASVCSVQIICEIFDALRKTFFVTTFVRERPCVIHKYVNHKKRIFLKAWNVTHASNILAAILLVPVELCICALMNLWNLSCADMRKLLCQTLQPRSCPPKNYMWWINNNNACNEIIHKSHLRALSHFELLPAKTGQHVVYFFLLLRQQLRLFVFWRVQCCVPFLCRIHPWRHTFQCLIIHGIVLVITHAIWQTCCFDNSNEIIRQGVKITFENFPRIISK